MKKKIVVLGAGFAGVRCVQSLQKKLDFDSFELTLVDKNNYHLFKADLYEIATGFNREIENKCQSRLSKSIAIPIDSLVDSLKVNFVESQVEKIDYEKNCVKLSKRKKLDYDYLVVALGAEPNYFNIPGLEKYGFTMQKLLDAVKINCHIDHFFYKLWKDKVKKNVSISVGGGGPTGVETAAELAIAVNVLLEKYQYPRSKVQINLLEGGADLAGDDHKVTSLIKKRLKDLGVNVYLNSYITKVSEKKINLKLGDGSVKILDSDITIWTGGVKVNSLIDKALLIDDFLQVKAFDNVFAAGDNAVSFENPLPMMAQVASQQGVLLANNLVAKLEGKEMKAFDLSKVYYIVPIGGSLALWKVGRRIFVGRWVSWLKSLAFLRYALSILPPIKAVQKWWHRRIFADNDC